MNHVDFNIVNEDEEEQSPLAYFKFFNGKFKRVELSMIRSSKDTQTRLNALDKRLERNEISRI